MVKIHITTHIHNITTVISCAWIKQQKWCMHNAQTMFESMPFSGNWFTLKYFNMKNKVSLY